MQNSETTLPTEQEMRDFLARIVRENTITQKEVSPEPDRLHSPETIGESRKQFIGDEIPPPPKPVEDFGFTDYVGDISKGIAYGASKGVGQMYNLALSAGNYIEEDLLEGSIDIVPNEEYEVEIAEPRSMAGQLASGVGQLGVGLVPGLAAVRLAGGIIKMGAYGLSRIGLSGGNTNLLATSMGKKAVSIANNNVVKSMAKGGATAGIAEQLVFDPQDPRLADLAASTDVPVLKDVGELLKYHEGDSETTARIKMAAEGLGIGTVMDGAVQLVSLFGRTIKPRTVEESPLGKKGKSLTVEELEELAKDVKIDGNPSGDLSPRAQMSIKNTLEKQGKSTEFINKYVGSINLNRINSSQYEIYNLINETGEALRDNYLKDNPKGKWPPTQTNNQSLEQAADLLGHNNVDTMLDVVSKNQGTLSIRTDTAGNIVLGSGLKGATEYSLAARQLLVDTADVVFDLAKEANTLKKQGRESLSEYKQVKAAYTLQLLAYESIQNTVNGIANESGRLLQSFNINIPNGPKARWLDDLVESGGKDIDSLIQSMAKQEFVGSAQLQKRIDLLKKGAQKNWLQNLRAGIGQYWYNSILSAPDTQIVNIAGNFGVQFARTAIEGTFGATRGSLRLLGAKWTGQEVDPSSVMLFGDLYQRLRGMSVGKASGSGKAKVVRLEIKQIDELIRQGKANPLVMDTLFYNIRAGRYGKNIDNLPPDQFVTQVVTKEGISNLYKKELDAMVDSHGSSVSNAAKTGRLFLEVLRKEMPVDPRYGRYEIAEQSGTVQAIPSAVGRVIRAPTTFMAAFDTAFKSVADNAALYEMASRQVRAIRYELQRKGGSEVVELADGTKVTVDEKHFKLVGDDGLGETLDPKNLNASEMIEYLVANPTPKMLQDAEKEFLEATFQQQNALTKGGETFRRILDKSGIGLGTALMPFVRTPINLLVYTLDRTPLGLLHPDVFKNKKMLKRLREVDVDDLTEEQAKKFRELSRSEELIKEQRINRQLAGMTYLTGAYSLAQAGIITGGGPTDYEERQRLRSTGWDPYSVKINDEYYPISRLDPFSQIAALASDFQFITNEMSQAKLSPAEREDFYALSFFVAKGMFKNLVTMISDKTYLKSMGEIMDTIYSPKSDSVLEKTLTASARVGGTIVGGLVPNIVSRTAESFASVDEEGNKQANFFYDPVIKASYVDMNVLRLFAHKVTSKIPGARDTLRDILGEENAGLYPRIDEFGSIINRAKAAKLFNDTDTNATFVGNTLKKIGNTVMLTRPGVRLPTAGLSATLAELKVKPKNTNPNIKIPGTNETKKLNAFLYYKKSVYEGERYFEFLMEAVGSEEYKKLYAISLENDSRKPVIDELRKDLIENAKKMAVLVTEDAMNNDEVYLLAGITDRVIQSAAIKESTLLSAQYEVLVNEKQKLMKDVFNEVLKP